MNKVDIQETTVSILGYKMDYPSMNLDLLNKDKKRFDMMIIIIHVNESRKGYKVKRIGKTTKKSTKVTYELINSEEDLKSYEKKLREMMSNFNKKYGTKYKLQ